jgi:signal transduction histidine kinase
MHPNDSIGIGLALSRDIIESQNGKIRVQSEPGSRNYFFCTDILKIALTPWVCRNIM